MKDDNYTTITLKRETQEKLLRRKKHPRQSYNAVIEELISNGKK